MYIRTLGSCCCCALVECIENVNMLSLQKPQDNVTLARSCIKEGYLFILEKSKFVLLFKIFAYCFSLCMQHQ